MTNQLPRRVLTVNTGSSSLKSGLYEETENGSLARRLSAEVIRIGEPGCRMRIVDSIGKKILDADQNLPSHESAIKALFEWIEGHEDYKNFEAAGHRVVHGGNRYRQPQAVTPDLISTLRGLVRFDPDHLPQAIAGIEAVTRLYPSLKQVACFDTAFHQEMPKVARMYALPREYFDEGVLRYGFHGLSYEYVVQQLVSIYGPSAGGRIIAAHLGNGASITAIRDGKSVDTTMGFTPTEGLVMGTRSGDIDPGVMVYLCMEKKMTAEEIDDLINKKAGLLGVSGISEDMRDLLGKEATNTSAAEAIDLFCYRAMKYIAAYVAVLGGLDMLVFTGGIGEHAAPVRSRICQGLEYLGVRVDEDLNASGQPLISSSASQVKIRVIPANEDVIIAGHTFSVIANQL
ncbi:MAG TPA: acetate/propionate family kinase [Blastocatellia bacterium]